jgi:hypothetical protein
MDEENLDKYLVQMEALRAEFHAIDFFDHQYKSELKCGDMQEAAFTARQQRRLAIIEGLHRLSIQVWVLTSPLSAVNERNGSPSNDGVGKPGEI